MGLFGQKLAFHVHGMTCQNCVGKIETAVLAIDGVKAVAVDLESEHLFVKGKKLDEDAIIAAVKVAGYEAH